MTFQGSIFPIRRGKHSRMSVLPSTSFLNKPISGRVLGLRFRRFTLFLMMILASVGAIPCNPVVAGTICSLPVSKESTTIGSSIFFRAFFTVVCPSASSPSRLSCARLPIATTPLDSCLLGSLDLCFCDFWRSRVAGGAFWIGSGLLSTSNTSKRSESSICRTTWTWLNRALSFLLELIGDQICAAACRGP